MRKKGAAANVHAPFQDLVDRHYRGLWSYISFLTGGAVETDDLSQEAFLLAFDRLAAGKEFTGDPGLWLRGTARNLVRAWWRRKRRVSSELAEAIDLLAEESDEPAEVLGDAEVQAALDRCLGKLGADDRRLIAQRYEEGLPFARIAEQRKDSAGGLRVRLFRLRQGLMACVQRQLSGKGTA
ncbi:MAG: sigma-70 family RNA polymerase sigma factor [Planctomycetes bacterium]|nr:sigma-70 family RNA polymerase sigma factor [Planctomycetota bacterium]